MLDAGLLAGALAGLTGSLHCLAMCGGYVAMSSGAVAAQSLLPVRRLRAGQAMTHLGRLTTYALLGGAFGAAGGAAFALEWPAAQRLLYVLANVVLLASALRMARPVLAAPVLERAGLAVFRQAAPLARPFIGGAGLGARYVLGMLWGLTPCALVYALLPVALLSGGALSGAAIMLGLWLGTLPALTLATGIAQRLATPRTRMVAAVVIASFALAGLYRAVFLPLASGPFCSSL